MLSAADLQQGFDKLRYGRNAAILRYALVGSCAAAIQIVLLAAFVELVAMKPVIASTCALTISITFNYHYQRRLTFHSSARHRTAAPTFLFITLSTLLANALLFSSLVPHLPYVLAQLATMGIIFPINYLLNRRITFRG
ncbi:GtrA family protein [Sphingomonas arenae]|uniref:GtrA family protein n=1 Tax=Sphingomonas arenae TaxID=2812555 RepID=UPI001967CE51|nr:GtrA family protein [Sphingomonas arenae]